MHSRLFDFKELAAQQLHDSKIVTRSRRSFLRSFYSSLFSSHLGSIIIRPSKANLLSHTSDLELETRYGDGNWKWVTLEFRVKEKMLHWKCSLRVGDGLQWSDLGFRSRNVIRLGVGDFKNVEWSKNRSTSNKVDDMQIKNKYTDITSL